MRNQERREAAHDAVDIDTGPNPAQVQLKRDLAGMSYADQVEAIRPPKPLMANEVQMSGDPHSAENSVREPRSGEEMIELPVPHPAVESTNRGDVRFRVPTFADLNSIWNNTSLKIPKTVIKGRVKRLLERLESDGTLDTSVHSVSAMMLKIFPKGGGISEAQFDLFVKKNDQTMIYRSVTDASAAVRSAEKPALTQAFRDAANIVGTVKGNTTGLTKVFGSKSSIAAGHYGTAQGILTKIASDLDAYVTTDYNLDDSATGVGGWANFKNQKMHLDLEIAELKKPKETKATIIHEACHLASNSIDDLGYYDTPGFEAMNEDKKVRNASHYEELPRRNMGGTASSYPGLTFTPGKNVGGGTTTRKDTIKKAVNDYMTKAWDAACDTHVWLRNICKAGQSNDPKPFQTNKKRIKEISQLTDLTIHLQDQAHAKVTVLDVTLIESIARAVSMAGDEADDEPVPAFGSKSNDVLRDEMIASAVGNCTDMLGDTSRDIKVIKWFHAHYRKVGT